MKNNQYHRRRNGQFTRGEKAVAVMIALLVFAICVAWAYIAATWAG